MNNTKQNIKSIVKEVNLFDKDITNKVNTSSDDLVKIIENVKYIQVNYPKDCLNNFDVLVKESIFHLLRINNMKTNNIALFILIGIKDLEDEHLSLSVREMSDVLLNQSNEVKMNDKLNTALSSIMDRSPKDIRERTTPQMKMKILQFMSNSDVLVESFTNEYNKLRNDIDDIIAKKLNERRGITRPTEVTINHDSSYENEMNKIYNEFGKENTESNPIMASYVDSAPDIFKDIDEQYYFYDETSGSFTPINSETSNKKILKKNDVEKILTEYGVSDFEMSKTISDLFNSNGKRLEDILNTTNNNNNTNKTTNTNNAINDNTNNNVNNLQLNNLNNINKIDNVNVLQNEVKKLKKTKDELYIYIYVLISVTILLFLILVVPFIYRKTVGIMRK